MMDTTDHLIFYLLDLVKSFSIGFRHLLAPHFTEVYKRRQLDIDPDILVDVLSTLCKNGAIVQSEDTVTHPKILSLSNVTADELHQWLRSERSPSYILTERGGDLWESYANPRWEDYIHPEEYRQYMIIRGAKKDRVARFVGLYDITWAGMINPIWAETQSWTVFYWKTLTGHFYEVTARKGASTSMIDVEYHQRQEELLDVLSGWYTHPILG